ncbi:MAG TPA: ribonuclease Z [Steroidobacteraceae bacterium]
MKLTVIGCGMATPDAARVCSGYYLETRALAVLLDCGPGVVHRMAELGIRWQEITHLCITHFHNDHIGDVSTLFFAWKWGMLPPRVRPVTVIGPHGTKRKLEQLADALGEHMRDTPFPVSVHELEPGEQRLLDDVVHVTAAKTPHTDESLCYRIDAPDASFGYTGDTAESPEVGAFLHGVHTLVMECSTPDDMPNPLHLTPSSAARMAALASPRQLVLTHAYPMLDRAALPQLIREAGWKGETYVAHDGLQLEVQLG